MTDVTPHTEDATSATQGREAISTIAEHLRKIDTCMLATRGTDGELQARPMSNNGQVDWDGSSRFFAPADGRLVAEISRDPSDVTTYRAEDRFAWVALSGRAVIVADEDEKRRHWLSELEHWFPEGPDDPNVALIRVEATFARWWTEGGDGVADLS